MHSLAAGYTHTDRHRYIDRLLPTPEMIFTGRDGEVHRLLGPCRLAVRVNGPFGRVLV